MAEEQVDASGVVGLGRELGSDFRSNFAELVLRTHPSDLSKARVLGPRERQREPARVCPWSIPWSRSTRAPYQ